MDLKLEDYCCICGRKVSDNRCDKKRIGNRGKTGDIPAYICRSCDYTNSWFLYHSVKKSLRFIVTDPSRLSRRFDKGYYVAAKPCDAVDWDYNDRLWLEVDRVYEARWDCITKPEGVRRAA